ncbi:MAG TPA: glycosyltransferase family 9 protein [Verrucomicrobiae bacterium]|nr:glycosyltransferase family 9 protein [Verrucomicrobiae bacterium]
MKPKLLIVELWGLGDLIIATSFLRAAQKKFEVTLLAKPYARDVQPRLWPDVRVETFVAPWTAFKHKYHFWRWPFLKMIRLRQRLARERFDYGLSARFSRGGGDPRDNLLLTLIGVKNRLGFSHLGSRMFVTQPVPRPEPTAHRLESWRAMAKALGLELEPSNTNDECGERKNILIHTGAGQPVRVWPLKHYQTLATFLRRKQFVVQIACDPDQRDWWLQNGETNVLTPHTVAELVAAVDAAEIFIGNDSGPGHLAAAGGLPTFTIFGPQLPEWFRPLDAQAEWIEGKACPYKPCSDYCRFPAPFCIQDIGVEEVIARVEQFLSRNTTALIS